MEKEQTNENYTFHSTFASLFDEAKGKWLIYFDKFFAAHFNNARHYSFQIFIVEVMFILQRKIRFCSHCVQIDPNMFLTTHNTNRFAAIWSFGVWRFLRFITAFFVIINGILINIIIICVVE